MNKIKNRLFRAIAVLIALCYLIEPAQNELRHVFHFLSHSLEPHDHINLLDIDEDLMQLMAAERHLDDHGHGIIDLFDKIFNPDSKDNNYPGKYKNDIWRVKKIIVKQCYSPFLNNLISAPKIDNFKVIRCPKYNMYSHRLDRPPQVLNKA